jgi:hypothetical protein
MLRGVLRYLNALMACMSTFSLYIRAPFLLMHAVEGAAVGFAIE